jgi:GT2 family glycosyltransferase
MPRVSVIVAAKNAATTLPATLESIARQSFTDWEVVVVDDGSDDDTAGVARSFTGRLVLVTHPASLGPSAARNSGARRASGELLAMLDADDEWKPGYLTRVVERFDAARTAGQAVGLVTTDADLVGAGIQGGVTHHVRVNLKQPVTLSELVRENVLTPMALCPRDVFIEVGGYDERLRYGEEYDLWLRIAEAGYTILADPEPLAVYRMHSSAASTDAVRMAEGVARVCELAIERGALTPRQRRVVRRQRRLHLAVVERARLATARRDGEPTMGRLVRSAPLLLIAALEHPGRWWKWLRRGPRPAQGAGRHIWTGERRRRSRRSQRRFDVTP